MFLKGVGDFEFGKRLVIDGESNDDLRRTTRAEPSENTSSDDDFVRTPPSSGRMLYTSNGAPVAVDGAGNMVAAATIGGGLGSLPPGGNPLPNPAPTPIYSSTTAAQITALGAGVSNLTATEIEELTPSAIGGFTSAEIPFLSQSQISALYWQATTGGLKPNAAKLASLNESAISALSPAQIASVSDLQLAQFSSAQIAALSQPTIGALTATQVYYLGANTNLLSNAQLESFTTAAMGGFRAPAIAALSDAQLSALTNNGASLSLLSSDNPAYPDGASLYEFSGLYGLTSPQISSLSPSSLGALSPAQLGALSAGGVSGLTAAQMAAIGTNITGLTSAQIPSLTAAALGGFSTAQIALLTTSQIEALTPAQIAVLTPAQFGSLTVAQLDALTSAQFTAITPQQVITITASNELTLSADQVNSLSPTAHTALLEALSGTTPTIATSSQIAALSSAPTYDGETWTASTLANGSPIYRTATLRLGTSTESAFYYFGSNNILYLQIEGRDTGPQHVGDVRSFWSADDFNSTGIPTYGKLAWTALQASNGSIGYTASAGFGQYYYLDNAGNVYLDHYPGEVSASNASANYVGWAPWYFLSAGTPAASAPVGIEYGPNAASTPVTSTGSASPSFNDPTTWPSNAYNAFETLIGADQQFAQTYQQTVATESPSGHSITLTFQGLQNTEGNEINYKVTIDPNEKDEPLQIVIAHEFQHAFDDVIGIDSDLLGQNNLVDQNGQPIGIPGLILSGDPPVATANTGNAPPNEAMNAEELRGEVAGAVAAYDTGATGQFKGPDWQVVAQRMTFQQFDAFIYQHYGMHISDIAKNPSQFFNNLNIGRPTPQQPQPHIGGGSSTGTNYYGGPMVNMISMDFFGNLADSAWFSGWQPAPGPATSGSSGGGTAG